MLNKNSNGIKKIIQREINKKKVKKVEGNSSNKNNSLRNKKILNF